MTIPTEDLNLQVIKSLRPREILYAESAEPGAMGACGTVRIYTLQKGELHFYLAHIDYRSTDICKAQDYWEANIYLHDLCRRKVLKQTNGGAGNIAWVQEGITFRRDDDHASFIYIKGKRTYVLECSCSGVYANIVTAFAKRPVAIEQVKSMLNTHRYNAFSSEEAAFISVYCDQCEYFDHGRPWLDFSSQDYDYAVRYIRYQNQMDFNINDFTVNKWNEALQKYRLYYIINKYGWNQLNEFFSKYIAKSPKRNSFFAKLSKALGENIEDKFAKLEIVKFHDAVDDNLFAYQGQIMQMFEYPVLANFSTKQHQQIIQAILNMSSSQLRSSAREIALYFHNYVFQDDKLSYAKALPATLHVVRELPADDFNHTYTADLFWIAGEIINNSWGVLDDEGLEKQFRDIIYDVYWPHIDGVWPIKYCDRYNFKNEVATDFFEEALGFIMSLPDLEKRNSELWQYLNSDIAKHNNNNAVRKRVFEISQKGASDQVYFDAILQEFGEYTAVQKLAYPSTVATAEFYLKELFSSKSKIQDKVCAFEQLLINPKCIGVGKVIIDHVVKHFSIFCKIIETEWRRNATASMFTAACIGATEEDELVPLQHFYDKVIKLENVSITELQNALVIAKRNVAACAFQRAEITEYLHANESIDIEQNMTKNNTSTLNGGTLSNPMEYNLHSTITADDRAAGLCYGRKLKEKIAEAMKKAGEEYESSQRK